MASNSSAMSSDTQGPTLRKLAITFTVLPTVALIVRIWSRLTSSSERKLWWDDGLALLAWACSNVTMAATFILVDVGLGRHFDTFSSPAAVVKFLKTLYWGELAYVFGLVFAKFSAMLFYWRIFAINNRRFKIAYWVTIAMLVIFTGKGVFSEIFVCYPPRKYWHREIPGHCTNVYTSFPIQMVGSMLDVITDLMILILPLPIITGLQIPKGRKYALLVVFFFGYAAWVTSVGRMGSYISLRSHVGEQDISWYDAPNVAWSIAEVGLSVFSICLPSCAGIFRRVYRNGWSALYSSNDVSSLSKQDKTRMLQGKFSTSTLRALPSGASGTHSIATSEVHDSSIHLTNQIVKENSFDISFQHFKASDELEQGRANNVFTGNSQNN